MTGNEVREKYLKFFENKKHKLIKPAPLVLKDDPTTLFTSSGMQPLLPNLLGEPHKNGKRLVDSQPVFRAEDIEEVGDNRHDTFFEMLGNWSLGDYFKKEQQTWIWEFYTKQLGLDIKKLYVTVFAGNKEIPRDDEAVNTWKELGVLEDHIYYYDAKKNWWARSSYETMPVGEPGGPSSEIFYEFTHVKHDLKFGDKCHPNCDCGKFVEIGNNVFMTYQKTDSGFELLEKKNIDFGGGLERILMAVNNQPDMFKNDLHYPIIIEIEKITGKKYLGNEVSMRIIADHMKASIFLIADGIIPSNKLQGYVLRRLLRRALLKIKNLSGDSKDENIFYSIIDQYMDIYNIYLRKEDVTKITDVILGEMRKFSVTLEKGLKEFEKFDDSQLNVLNAFNLYQSYGFPFEVTQELFEQKGKELSKVEFDNIMKEHQELSRNSSKFQ